MVYTVTRRPNWYWWRGDNEYQKTLKTDTIKTDEEGHFHVPVVLTMPEAKNNMSRYYIVEVSATVTDGAGESHEGSLNLPLSNRSTYFYCRLPERIERDSMLHFTFDYKNLSGQNIAAKIDYKVDNTVYQANANESVTFDLGKLKSGRHTLEAICGEDTLHCSFTVFSLKDKKPADEAEDWFYASSDHFREDG